MLFLLLVASWLAVTVGEPSIFVDNTWKTLVIPTNNAPSVKIASSEWKNDDANIYISIVSYRDRRCAVTLNNLFSKANNPKRLFVGKSSVQLLIEGINAVIVDRCCAIQTYIR